MNRLLTVTLAILVSAVAILAIARPWESTTAQSDPSLYVSVNELRFGWTPDLPDGGQCTFTGQLFGLLSSVPMHIVVEDAEHRTIAVRQVSGTIQHNDEEDWYRCDATFDMPLEESAFYRVFINDVYHSTVASDQLMGSGVILLLESGESWRPVS